MSLRPSDLPVLQAALRTRIAEAAPLADILRVPVQDVRETLDRLTADGMIVRTADGSPALSPPQRSIVDNSLAELRSQLAALDPVLDSLEALPGRLRRWVGAHAGERAHVPMELSHGPDAIVNAWWRLREQARPVDAFGCFPDPAALVRVAIDGATDRPSPQSRVRIITGRGVVPKEVAAAAAALQDQGAELRCLDATPGWFGGEGGQLSAFPTAWGVSWPLSVRILRDPLASRSLRSLFDELWRRAVPLEEVPAEWEAVLRLLEKGLDDAAVAKVLGVSERTVRRRIEEAMLELGATNRFTLGRAWAKWTTIR